MNYHHELSHCVTHILCVRLIFVCLHELFLQFCVKSRKANFCLIRQHAHTPARVISLLYGADVKGLTELHDTDNSEWSQAQITTGFQTHMWGKPQWANLSRGGTHGNVKAQLRKPERTTLFYHYYYYCFFGQRVSRQKVDLKTACIWTDCIRFGKAHKHASFVF